MIPVLVALAVGIAIGWIAERLIFRLGIRVMRRQDIRFDAAWLVMKREMFEASERRELQKRLRKMKKAA